MTLRATPRHQAARQTSARFKNVSLQEEATMSDGTYVLSFYPYYNGNDAIWEGIVHFQGGGNDDVDYVMFDITSETTVPTIQEYNYSNNGGGGCGACGGGGENMVEHPAKKGGPIMLKASYTAYLNLSSPIARAGRLQRWAWCAAGGCWGGVFPCRWTGPAWAKCAAANCVGSMIGCAIENMM